MQNLNIVLSTFNVGNNFSLAFGYLKAYAMKNEKIKNSSNILISDFSKESNDIVQVLYYFNNLKPDVIGFSCYCWNLSDILELSKLVKKVLPETFIVLGGPEVSPVADEILSGNKDIDFIVRGEGEVTFAELIRYFLQEEKIENITGLSFRENGEIIHNEDRELIENLDEIPSPYLTGILTPRDNVSYIATYRGCPYKCAYCFEGKNYPKLRFFSEERTDAEIKLIMNDENVKSFSIIDPVFNLNKLKTEKLTKILSERNIGNTKLHTIEIITEHIDQETVTLFKKANIESVETGPQTVNEDTLKNVSRYFEKEKFGAGIKLFQKNGINVICDLIIGLPGDNFIKFLNSIKYIYSLHPNRVVFSTLHVLPGTQLFNESDRFGLEFDEKPPHYVISAKTFSFADIRKAEIMSKSLEKEYSLSL